MIDTQDVKSFFPTDLCDFTSVQFYENFKKPTTTFFSQIKQEKPLALVSVAKLLEYYSQVTLKCKISTSFSSILA